MLFLNVDVDEPALNKVNDSGNVNGTSSCPWQVLHAELREDLGSRGRRHCGPEQSGLDASLSQLSS